MTDTGELRRENEALRERIARLSAAVLRISASLDVMTVLQEVVDSARALTGARYGSIATVDAAGQPQDFVTSGLTPDEQRELLAWPDGPRLFAHLRDLPGPLRPDDLPGYIRSHGYGPDFLMSKTLQMTPMRHLGAHVGHFFLGEKEGALAFTDEDEEVLVLFASQAATAIANAHTYRKEQRDRADLEALVETSPVGVVVFDAGTGHAVSFSAGRVVTYDSLLRQVWGQRESDDPQRVRTFVKKLRTKLGDDAARPASIHTERGVGYPTRYPPAYGHRPSRAAPPRSDFRQKISGRCADSNREPRNTTPATFVAARRRGEFLDSSLVRTHVQSRAQIESPRARVPYTAGCEFSPRRLRPP